jgi:hypothetical protein
MNRAVLWLLLGLALTGVLMVVLVPGALGNLADLGGLVALVLAAGVPGLVVILVLVARRRDEQDEQAARAQPDRISPIATSPEWDPHRGDDRPSTDQGGS